MFSNLITGLLAALLLQAPAGTPVDERIVSIPVCEDTYVRNGAHVDTNFGTADTLELKGSELYNYERKIYLKFSLPSDTDSSFAKAVIELEPSIKEAPARPLPVMLYECGTDWSENELTYSTQPTVGKLVATAESTGKIVLDVTAALKERQSLSGDAAFVLTGDYNSPLRANFYTRENEQLSPRLKLFYGKSHIMSALPTAGKENPWIYAQSIISASTAGTTEALPDENIIPASDTAFVRAGKYADMNFAGYKYLSCDSLAEPADMPRKSYLKFNLDGVNPNKIDGAYLDMFIVTIHDNAAHEVAVAEVSDNSWSEHTITYSNAPEIGNYVATALADLPGAWIRFDITEYVKARLAEGKTLSLALLDTGGYRVDFASNTHALAPSIKIKAKAAAADEYDAITEAKLYPDTPNYTRYKTRLVSSLKGFSPKQSALGKYGGFTGGKRYAATGFFHTEKIDDRWWFIDPEGYPFYNIGVSAIMPGDSEAENLGRSKVYGSYEAWAEKTAAELKDLGFNTAGGWSDFDRLANTSEPMAQSCIVYFLKSYMAQIGLDSSTGGNTTFANGVLNVFDPDFESFCDAWAQQNIAKHKDNPYIIGWISDNELPISEGLLDNYLNVDTGDPRNAYSYAAAWQWLRSRTNKANPDLADVTDALREEFREFVFDRYFSVICGAIKKYDPNHLYLGCRLTNDGYSSKGVLAAAGRYCDVVTMNYYGAWTPEEQFSDRWKQWSGDTPFMVTEWYAMAYDSGLACVSGAGFRVPTQADRGKFYQNYALGLMEKQNCVGFDWFKYMDNDPNALNRDSSNKDGNKGIYSIEYAQYPELADKMKELNQNAYALIEYLDKR